MCGACRVLLDAWTTSFENPTQRPVIVIDEANTFMRWEKYPEDRDRLMRFFVQVTKQANCCHVLMATSDYSYQNWMSDGKYSLQIVMSEIYLLGYKLMIGGPLEVQCS